MWLLVMPVYCHFPTVFFAATVAGICKFITE